MKDKRTIVSASRRTDIPGFYMPWFMDCVKKKRFILKNPYSKKISTLSFTPDSIAAIFFWSKDYSSFLNNSHGKKLKDLGFELFFHHTINSKDPLLEPGIKTSVKKRCENIDILCNNFGPERVFLRFDPIVFYEDDEKIVKNNLHDFEYIVTKASKSGVKKLVVGFTDLYKKLQPREKKKNIRFLKLGDPDKKKILLRMTKLTDSLGMNINLCCETIDGVDDFIKREPCISAEYINKILKTDLSNAKDYGQRKDCCCSKSRDIGSYIDHPCSHNCLYCYARPSGDL